MFFGLDFLKQAYYVIELCKKKNDGNLKKNCGNAFFIKRFWLTSLVPLSKDSNNESIDDFGLVNALVFGGAAFFTGLFMEVKNPRPPEDFGFFGTLGVSLLKSAKRKIQK